MWVPQFVLPNHLLFMRRQTNPGVWAVPFDGGALDLTSASMVQPGAADFDAGARRHAPGEIPAEGTA